MLTASLKGDRIEFAGGTYGRHSLDLNCSDADRVLAHWSGYCDATPTRTIQRAMTPAERAVRKASGARLLRDFAQAARIVEFCKFGLTDAQAAETTLAWAAIERSRTRYACLMTAWGL